MSTDVDFVDDYKVYDERKELSRKVEISQAILCDDMAAVDQVQLGPTGKSVSRLYLKAISKLVSDCELSTFSFFLSIMSLKTRKAATLGPTSRK